MYLWIKRVFILQIRAFWQSGESSRSRNVTSNDSSERCAWSRVRSSITLLEQSQGAPTETSLAFSSPTFNTADLFAVDIDLDTKRFVNAKLDDENLTPMQILFMLWHNTISAQHVKLHAYANWGVNDSISLNETNPFLRQNSVVTILYNFFGYTLFEDFMKAWEKQGLLSKGWFESKSLIKCFNHGIHEGIRQHPHISDLSNDSKFVNFTIKVRSIFMSEFAKHKDMFPGIDGEVHTERCNR